MGSVVSRSDQLSQNIDLEETRHAVFFGHKLHHTYWSCNNIKYLQLTLLFSSFSVLRYGKPILSKWEVVCETKISTTAKIVHWPHVEFFGLLSQAAHLDCFWCTSQILILQHKTQVSANVKNSLDQTIPQTNLSPQPHRQIIGPYCTEKHLFCVVQNLKMHTWQTTVTLSYWARISVTTVDKCIPKPIFQQHLVV